MPSEQREMKDPEENINHHEDKSSGIEIGLEIILEIVLEIHKTEIEGIQEVLIGIEINLERIQVIDQMIEKEMVEMILDKNPTGILNIVIKVVILGNTVGRYKPMLRKAEGLKEMDDRDDDPSDTFNSMVSEDPISDDDLDRFIRNFSDMTELN